MTFDLNVSDIDLSSDDKLSESSKVVFNLLEDGDAEELEQNEKLDTIVEFDDEGDKVIIDADEPSEADDSLKEEDISFQIDTDNEQDKEEESIDLVENSSEDKGESHQKIVHTLSMEDEGLSDDNSSRSKDLIDGPNLISETEEEQSISFDFNASPISEEAPIEIVKSSDDHEQKSITQSTTNSKAVQEQINRAQKRKERLQKFNYRFRNNSGVELTENEPAYKRQGIELDDIQHSSEETVSNLNLGENQDGEFELKSKNSFLHDNVD